MKEDEEEVSKKTKKKRRNEKTCSYKAFAMMSNMYRLG